MRTYKYRLYPTKEQQDTMWAQATNLNRLYNLFLNLKINTYKDHKISLSKNDLSKILTDLKFHHPALRQTHSQVLQAAIKRLDQTFNNFFKSGFGFPKFRSNKNFFGLLYPQSGYVIGKKCIYLTKIGRIKYIRHRELEGDIKQIFVTRDNDNKWYVCITTDMSSVDCPNNDSIIGIDLGISKFATLSNGKHFPKLKDVKYFSKQINKLKSIRDKNCKRYSRAYKKLSLVIKRLYGAKNRKVNDFLHKVSKHLSINYDTIVIEDLNIKQMSESDKHSLNREIRDVCWSRFITFLEYKCKKLIKVDPYNTSKKCHNCGKIHNMTLKDRRMSCDCGTEIDRDHNAAINILCLGQAIL